MGGWGGGGAGGLGGGQVIIRGCLHKIAANFIPITVKKSLLLIWRFGNKKEEKPTVH